MSPTRRQNVKIAAEECHILLLFFSFLGVLRLQPVYKLQFGNYFFLLQQKLLIGRVLVFVDCLRCVVFWLICAIFCLLDYLCKLFVHHLYNYPAFQAIFLIFYLVHFSTYHCVNEQRYGHVSNSSFV